MSRTSPIQLLLDREILSRIPCRTTPKDFQDRRHGYISSMLLWRLLCQLQRELLKRHSDSMIKENEFLQRRFRVLFLKIYRKKTPNGISLNLSTPFFKNQGATTGHTHASLEYSIETPPRPPSNDVGIVILITYLFGNTILHLNQANCSRASGPI